MGYWGPTTLSTQEVYDLIKNQQPNTIVLINQHVQDGGVIRYFPTDVLDGEVTVPPAAGHTPFRTVNGKRYYLPFEFEPVSQHGGSGFSNTPQGPVGAWFT